jgi:hypothetical protein
MAQWLDEVRAQRRAWEERRRAAKEAIDARRRWINPWGAAQKEAREKENQRRREAFMEHIEREREAFRSGAPWGSAPGPWEEAPQTDKVPHMPGPPESRGPEGSDEVPTGPSPYPQPPGWDNRWYYRGY